MENNLLESLPKIQMMFLGEKGLSQTEAGHQCNILNAKVAQVERSIQMTGAFKETLVYEGQSIPVNDPTKIEDFLTIAKKKGEYHSLSAWLAEGIKAKEDVLNMVKYNWPVYDFFLPGEALREVTIDYPVQKTIVAKVFTDVDVINECYGIADRQEYLQAEAMASHIGKLIHKDKKLDLIIKDLSSSNRLSYKTLPGSTDRKTYPVKLEPVYAPSELDAQYMLLQAEHREWEKKVNAHKAFIKDEIAKMEMAESDRVLVESRKAYDEYMEKKRVYDNHRAEVDAHNANLREACNKRKTAMVNAIAKLKIIIPKALQPVYDSIQEPKTK